MFKMKSVLYIVAIFSLALASCTERIEDKQPSDVQNGVITMVSASVKPLVVEGLEGVGNYQWGERELGIVLSNGENVRYLPVKSTTGDSEAYFYGDVVDGEMSIYMPYSNENGERAKAGRLSMLPEQTYYADPFDHLMYNSNFLATTTGTHVEFDYYAGLLKVEVQYELYNIDSVQVMVGNIETDGTYDSFVSGDYSISNDKLDNESSRSESVVVKMPEKGLNATVENPLTLWVALAPGTYQNFIVIVKGENKDGENLSITLPVKGENEQKEESPFVVERCALTPQTCVAKKVDYDNGIGDLEGKPGEFNPVE